MVICGAVSRLLAEYCTHIESGIFLFFSKVLLGVLKIRFVWCTKFTLPTSKKVTRYDTKTR